MHYKNKNGYTMIELLIVVFIIGLITSVSVLMFNNARAKSRDARRFSDITVIRKAILLFYDDYNRYPDLNNDGVSNAGELIGDDDGPIEQALKPYLTYVPEDPLFDGSGCGNCFFYAYDPRHFICDPVVSINRLETTYAKDNFSQIDTTEGGDKYINQADYNYCFRGKSTLIFTPSPPCSSC